MITIVDNLGLTQAQRGKVASIVAAVQAYVEGLINESVERRISAGVTIRWTGLTWRLNCT